MNPHNAKLVKQIDTVRAHLRNASEDAAEDFHAGIDHASIALGLLREIVQEGRRANPLRHLTPGGSVECPHCHWGFSPTVIEEHIREKH